MKSRLASPLFVLALLAPLAAWSEISVSINIGPPPLPVYVQPAVPGEGYIWTPGYWSWNPADNDYYWVPGTWVLAPAVGYLWTPGYWGYAGGGYLWHRGYWADRVGFYGGIDYGYGYTGSGYWGGRWDRGVFNYNRSVSNVNTTVVHNVYNTTVVNNNFNGPRVSFNGGPQGVAARPTPAELQAQARKHIAPTPNQIQLEHSALAMPTQRASVNHGTPQVAATPKPTAFTAPVAGHARNEVAATRPVPAAATQPGAVPRSVPAPPRAESRMPSPRAETQMPAGRVESNVAPVPREPRVARGAEPQAVHGPRPVPQVQEGATAERQGRARPEAAPHPEAQARAQAQQPRPEAQPHAQPQQSRPEPQPHAQPQQSRPEPQARAQPQPPQPPHPQAQPERAQPNARAEPHAGDKRE